MTLPRPPPLLLLFAAAALIAPAPAPSLSFSPPAIRSHRRGGGAAAAASSPSALRSAPPSSSSSSSSSSAPDPVLFSDSSPSPSPPPSPSSALPFDDYSSSPVTVGDADRSFRLGVQLERYGSARPAAAAFHEAATLYQCFLDHHAAAATSDDESAVSANAAASNEFGHVTGLSPDVGGPDSCPAVLAYACVRLAHLSHDALGDSKAATRLYREAASIDPNPSSVAYDGLGAAIEGSGGDLREAARAYEEARRISPGNGNVLFHLAVAYERLGRTDDSEEIFDVLRRGGIDLSCLVDSWGYVRWHTRKVPPPDLNLHRGTRSMLQIGLDAAGPLVNEGGLVCEFGVSSGRSTRMMQEILPLDVPIHGFDTFTGLPHAWGDEPAGSYGTGGNVPNMEGEVYFHRGLFTDTIPPFLEGTEDRYRPLAFANVDCDLYGSTMDVLEGMYGRVVPGTVLAFDEYLCHPTWRQDEFRAWRECCKRFGWHYEYLAFSLGTKQAVVRVTAA